MAGQNGVQIVFLKHDHEAILSARSKNTLGRSREFDPRPFSGQGQVDPYVDLNSFNERVFPVEENQVIKPVAKNSIQVIQENRQSIKRVLQRTNPKPKPKSEMIVNVELIDGISLQLNEEKVKTKIWRVPMIDSFAIPSGVKFQERGSLVEQSIEYEPKLSKTIERAKTAPLKPTVFSHFDDLGPSQQPLTTVKTLKSSKTRLNTAFSMPKIARPKTCISDELLSHSAICVGTITPRFSLPSTKSSVKQVTEKCKKLNAVRFADLAFNNQN